LQSPHTPDAPLSGPPERQQIAVRHGAGLRFLVAALLVVLVTAAYLAGPARDTMDAATAIAVLIHLGIGVAVIPPVAWHLWRGLRGAAGSARVAWSAAAVFALLCAATGLYLIARAASGHSTAHDEIASALHWVTGVVAALCGGAWVGRSRRRGRPDGAAGHDVAPREMPDAAKPLAAPSGADGFHAGALRTAPVSSGRSGLPRDPAPAPVRTGQGERRRDAHPRPEIPRRRLAPAALLLLLTQGALFGGAALAPRYDAEAFYRDLTATTPAQAGNPLFPAALHIEPTEALTRIRSGATAIPTSESCGAAGCHPAELATWHQSAHRVAGADPFYLAASAECARSRGPAVVHWCEGCHAPTTALEGTHSGQEAVGNATQTPRITSHEPQAASHEPRTSYQLPATSHRPPGVGCYACHGVTGAAPRSGNGGFQVAAPQDYPFATASGPYRALHDFLLRVRPGPHQRAYLKPELHSSSEFCGSCHRQSLSVAQNHYQFVRGIDEFGEWERGPASGRSAGTAGPQPPRGCQECHFPTSGGRTDHAAGGGVALASVNGAVPPDAAVRLLRSAVTVDIFALRRAGDPARGAIVLVDHPGPAAGPGGADAGATRGIRRLADPRAAAIPRPGERWLLDVVVTNRAGGHAFPAGYPDLTDAWLEVTVRDASGRLLRSNGLLPNDRAPVPANAHAYGAVHLDRAGAPLLHHEIVDEVTTAFRRTIPAGGSDLARYALTIPRGAARDLRVTVRVRYRSVRPDFARWALAATDKQSAAGIKQPIFDLAEAVASIPVQGASALPGEQTGAPPTNTRGAGRSPGRQYPEAAHGAPGRRAGQHPAGPVLPPSSGGLPAGMDTAARRAEAERFEAYGAALLAPAERPDIAAAVASYGAASRLTPDRPQPWIGLGRAYLREPDLRLAAASFERALRCDPASPAALAKLSVVYDKQGQQELAIQTLTPLAARFPLDPDLRYDLGIALFRAGRYAEAAESFHRSLAIDPDQYAAHFQLKRCSDVLRRVAEGRVEDSITRYMAEDRAAGLLVPPFLARHPALAEPFPVHELR